MRDQPHALLLACPADDITAAASVIHEFGMALLPAGGVGDLEQCSLQTPLYLVEIGVEGVRASATWHATLLGSVPLSNPDPSRLLPSTWTQRHAHAYAQARGFVPMTGDSEGDDEEDDDDEPALLQVFIPVMHIETLPKNQWLFTNELVPKQARGGRRFAPRVPTLVHLPE